MMERRNTPGDSSPGARRAGGPATVTDGTLGRVIEEFPAEGKKKNPHTRSVPERFQTNGSSFTSLFVLCNCRPSCPCQHPQDPRQSGYNECTPEQHKTHKYLLWRLKSKRSHSSSHPIAGRQHEWLQGEDECRRVVTGEELRVIAHIFQDTPEQIQFKKNVLLCTNFSCPSYPLLPMMG